MFYKVNEFVYFKKDNYTFKEELISDSNYRKPIHCFVVVSGNVTHGLLEGYDELTIDDMDQAVKDYLRCGRRLVNFEYANAKPLIELTNYKLGE